MSNKLSIIIPCYNSTKTQEETVTSVYIQHLITPCEMMVVDDGFVDGINIETNKVRMML